MNKLKYILPLVGLIIISQGSRAQSLDSLRQQYSKVTETMDKHQVVEAKQQMQVLREYPLFPYLRYRLLTEDLTKTRLAEVQDFINSYPELPLSQQLKISFINELARRSDWIGIIRLSPQPPMDIGAKCQWYNAQLATGHSAVAWRGADDIWPNGRNLPDSCETLFSSWRKSHAFSAERILTRIGLAYQLANDALVTQLINQLAPQYSTMASQLRLVLKDPHNVTAFASNVASSEFSQQIVMQAFSRLARLDPQLAKSLLPTLAATQQLSDDRQQSMRESIVWQLMGNNLSLSQQQWRDSVISASHSTALLERRIRLALSQQDLKEVSRWIHLLQATDRDKDEWQYWLAMTLFKEGDNKQAEKLLIQLTKRRGFYPMVAAQKLDRPYVLRIEKVAPVDGQLLQSKVLARVNELMYWHQDDLARNEWLAWFNDLTLTQQQGLAGYALQQQWWDLAVQATIKAKMWDNLQQRFPAAWLSLFQHYARNKQIPVSYAMATARQESAMNPTIQSSAGAVGLMQLMPATALHTAKVFKVADYHGQQQLKDPATNINLGMLYLESLYKQFAQNRILSSSAYNAGPSRVKKWLDNSNGRLDAVSFIETIPFTETRNYIKNILAYDVYYRHFQSQPEKILTDQEWNRYY